MPEDTTVSTDEEQEAGTSGIVHDDIMQRLLEYQRQLREGLSPDAAAEASQAERETAGAATATATQEPVVVVDITDAEAELETTEAPAEIAEEDAEAPAATRTGSIETAAALQEADTAATSEPVSAREEPRPSQSVWATPPAAPAAGPDLSNRVAQLESTLERVNRMIGDLRAQFQDMAIAADERFAAIEDALSETPTAG